MLLQGVGRRTLEGLARSARVCEIAAQAPIVVEGDVEDCFYVLISGRAAVAIGEERRRALLPGDGFGEIAVLHRVPRSASVIAEEACRLLAVPGEGLRAAAQERGGILGGLAAAPTQPGAFTTTA
jgi:CRP-like cAMP-binding protein